MESPFYLIVRAVAAGYILYRIWCLLFNGASDGFWEWVLQNAREHASRRTVATKGSDEGSQVAEMPGVGADIVGRTHTVYLEDPRSAVTTFPAMSQPLEPSGYIGVEAGTSANDVDATLSTPSVSDASEEPARDEDTGAEGAPPDEDFDRCLTYEQMNEAMDILAGGRTDEDKTLRAAAAIYGVRNSDLFDFFIMQAGSAQAVESLLAEYLDEGGEPLPANMRKSFRRLNTGFDIEKYV